MTTDLGARDRDTHLHPFTDPALHATAAPLVIARGEGVFLIGADGRRYLDAMSGLWCAALGYSVPRLAEAAARQMRELPFSHSFRSRTHPKVVELSERLLALAPVPMARVFFAASGSEANETALRIAWHCGRVAGGAHRNRILSLAGGYHGSTLATAALGGPPAGRPGVPPRPDWALVGPRPLYPREATPGETEAAFCDRLVAEVERIIATAGPETVAAFIVEPVMGVGGVVVPPAGFLPRIQAILRSHGILLIADETICGFGRTGAWWGSNRVGLVPDILVCAKALSSACFPISAVMMTDSVHRALVEDVGGAGGFAHGFTASGHPVGAAVALETLAIHAEEDLPARARRIGALLLEGLAALVARHDAAQSARGIGLMAALELAGGPAAAEALAARALDLGLILRPLGNAVAMAPPLVIGEDEIGMLLDRLELALRDCSEQRPGAEA